MKKLIYSIISLISCFVFISSVDASGTPSLIQSQKELVASNLAYIDEVYRHEGEKVANISAVPIELKSVLGDWIIEKVSVGGGSVAVGFEGIILKGSQSDDVIIAFKGTAGGQLDKDWIDNNIALSSIQTKQENGLLYHPQDAEALTFAKDYIESHTNKNITLTGHSLGGHLAQYVKIKLDLVEQKVVTFNSLGVVAVSQLSNFTTFIDNTVNFVIQGEQLDQINKLYGASNVGENIELALPGSLTPLEKHSLVNFYTILVAELNTKGTITSTIYEDKNLNGVKDADEVGVSNVKVTLYSSDGLKKKEIVTDATGRYTFNQLDQGKYYVELSVSSTVELVSGDFGFDFKSGYLDLKSGQTVNIKAGVISHSSPTGTVSVLVYEDINKNGKRDEGEPKVSVKVELYKINSEKFEELITSIEENVNDVFLVSNGYYYEQFTLPENYTLVSGNVGTDLKTGYLHITDFTPNIPIEVGVQSN